jgi:hypothetical protein
MRVTPTMVTQWGWKKMFCGGSKKPQATFWLI